MKDAKTGKMCRIAPEIVDVHIDEAGVKTLDVVVTLVVAGNIYRDSNDRFKILGHPILIGDVLTSLLILMRKSYGRMSLLMKNYCVKVNGEL